MITFSSGPNYLRRKDLFHRDSIELPAKQPAGTRTLNLSLGQEGKEHAWTVCHGEPHANCMGPEHLLGFLTSPREASSELCSMWYHLDLMMEKGLDFIPGTLTGRRAGEYTDILGPGLKLSGQGLKSPLGSASQLLQFPMSWSEWRQLLGETG